MTILQSTVHERAPQEDKSHTTYETTRWLVSFLVTYNPGSISFVGPGGGAIPIPSAGAMPVSTDRQIREYLEEPRGQLVIRSASSANFSQVQLVNPANDPNSLVLLSPAKGRPCDVRRGPFCKVNSIQHIAGERMWKIHLTFETYVTGTNAGQTRSLILNNRWSVHSDIDWQHMATRIYQGICTVNANLLNDPVFNPPIAGYRRGILDSIRQSFAGFSVPLGFQRTFVKVEMTPDGNNAVYVVRDEQRKYDQPQNPNVPRIEVQDSNFASQGSYGRAALQTLSRTNAPPVFSGPSAIGGWFRNTVLDQPLRAGAANLPKFNRNVVVRVWGNRQIGRDDLVSIALGVGSARMGNAAILDTTTSEIVITGDSNRCITLNWTCSWGMDASLGAFVGSLVTIGNLFAPGLIGGPGGRNWRNSAGLELNVVTAKGFKITNAVNANPQMGGVGQPANSVSTNAANSVSANASVAQMITQVLEGFGAAPGAAP